MAATAIPQYRYIAALPPPPRFAQPDDSPGNTSGNASGGSASSSPSGSPAGSPSIAPQPAPQRDPPITHLHTAFASSNPAPKVLRICSAGINLKCAGGCGNAHIDLTQIETVRAMAFQKGTDIVCQFHQSHQCRWGDRCPNLHTEYTLAQETVRLDTERAQTQSSAPSTPPRAPGPLYTKQLTMSDPSHLSSRRTRCTSGDAPRSAGNLDPPPARPNANRSSSHARMRQMAHGKTVRQPQVLHDLSLTRGKFTDLHKVSLLLEELTARTGGSSAGVYSQNHVLAENFQREATARVKELNEYLDKCLERLGAFHQAVQQQSTDVDNGASADDKSPMLEGDN